MNERKGEKGQSKGGSEARRVYKMEVSCPVRHAIRMGKMRLRDLGKDAGEYKDGRKENSFKQEGDKNKALLMGHLCAKRGKHKKLDVALGFGK